MNPLGRIASRFSHDVSVSDDMVNPITNVLIIVMTILFSLLGIIISVWWFIFPALVAIVIIVAMQQVYTRTSLELRRLEAIATSQVCKYSCAKTTTS